MMLREIKGKKGLSEVISTILIITLVIITTSIVWVAVNKIVKESQSGVESCFDIFEKVSINREYSCYNATSNEVQVSVNIADIDPDAVLVSISGEGETDAIKITREGSLINYVSNYGNPSDPIIKLPGKNAGKTYVFNLTGLGIGTPNSITLAPIINQKQCEISDTMSRIDDCRILV